MSTDWNMNGFDWTGAGISGVSSSMLALSDSFLAFEKNVINVPSYVMGIAGVLLTAKEAYNGNLQGAYEYGATTIGGLVAGSLAGSLIEAAALTVVFGPAGVFVAVASAAAAGTMLGCMASKNYTMDQFFHDLNAL